jgi:altered-inheritance-of-mitochondria protein 5
VQTGGVTLTLGIAYLTVLAHERNRQAQAQALRSQAQVLNGLLEPTPLPPPQSRAELAREERSTLIETAKDRWNAEVENAVRWVQRTDWGEVREGMEGAIARLLGTGLERSREGIEEAEKKAGPKVQEAVNRSKAAARQGADQAAAGTISEAEKAGALAKEQLSRAGAKSAEIGSAAKAKADRVVADARSGAQDAADKTKAKSDQAVANAKSGAQEVADKLRHSGGTVDAARGAVRDAVHKGIEKGKEAISKAQAVVGLATDKLESKGQAATLSHSSAVEKALHERYEKPDGLNKSVEETLEERYKPIDTRDNTVLRGV